MVDQDSKAHLVDQVKNLQRSGPAAKQAWWEYCDTHLDGIHDPKRHDASVLQAFLRDFDCGGGSLPTPAPVQAFAAWQPPLHGEGHWRGGPPPDLISLVKTGQRVSQSWKMGWQAYTTTYGTGMNDPARYDPEFIVGFLDTVGQLVEGQIGGMSVPCGGGIGYSNSVKRPVSTIGLPPSKRVAVGGPSNSDLVERVKALQRRDQETKEAWWRLCDEILGGVRDPARHDLETLQIFVSDNE